VLDLIYVGSSMPATTCVGGTKSEQVGEYRGVQVGCGYASGLGI